MVMVSQRCMHKLMDPSKIWFELIKKKFDAPDMRKLQSAPFVFYGNRVIAGLYVDSSFVIFETEENLNHLKGQLMRDLMMMDPGRPSSFSGIEIIWKKNAVYLKQKQ